MRPFFKNPLWQLFVFSFLLYVLFNHANLYGYEPETWQSARQLAITGEFTHARAGYLHIIAYLPFVILQRLVPVAPWLIPSLVIAFFSALIPPLMFLLARELFENRRVAIQLALILATATSIFPYAIIGMEHLLTLALVGGAWATVRYLKGRQSHDVILAGLFFGAAYASKSYAGVLIPLMAILIVIYERRYRNAGKFLLSASCFVAVGILLNYIRFGNVLSGAYVPSVEFHYQSLIAGIYGFFFSAGKSIFIYSPVFLLALFGIPRFWKEHRAVSVGILAVLAAFLGLHAPFEFWTDETWGVRKLVPLIPVLLLPLGCLIRDLPVASRSLRWLFWLVLAISIGVQLLGVLYDYGKQLTMFRSMGLDTLPFMQYVPQLSHLGVNWLLFKAYLIQVAGGQAPLFVYEISSWLRQLASMENHVLAGGSFVIEKTFARPQVWFFGSSFAWYSKAIIIAALGTGIIGAIRRLRRFAHQV